jgi:hypothetical protein
VTDPNLGASPDPAADVPSLEVVWKQAVAASVSTDGRGCTVTATWI